MIQRIQQYSFSLSIHDKKYKQKANHDTDKIAVIDTTLFQ